MTVKIGLIKDNKIDYVKECTNGRIVFGRDGDLDILKDEQGLSREHSEILIFDNAALYRDKGSTNGSWINGEAVEVDEWTPLEFPSFIQMANVVLKVWKEDTSKLNKDLIGTLIVFNGELLPGITAELGDAIPLDKLEFGCFENEVVLAELKSYKDVDTWVCCGVETHICMYQTVLGGIREGYRMWIPADAVSSRTEKNYYTGLDRIRQIGGVVANTELIIYELLHKAGTPEFKSLLPFLK